MSGKHYKNYTNFLEAHIRQINSQTSGMYGIACAFSNLIVTDSNVCQTHSAIPMVYLVDILYVRIYKVVKN